MDYDRVTERVLSGLVQGFVVAFVGLATFLPASYVMNRYIYRTWTMRTFMGILAALTGLGGLVILLLLRLYNGDSMLIHYFGMLPIRTKVDAPPTTDRSWIVSIILWIIDPIFPPITFYYDSKDDKEGYAHTIKNLLETFNTGTIEDIKLSGVAARVSANKNAVSEDLFQTARELGAYAALNIKDWTEFVVDRNEAKKPGDYTGLAVGDAEKVGKALFDNP
jgi:hypothetical protein